MNSLLFIRVTAGNGVTEKIEPGETKTLKKGSNILQYLRLVHVGEEEDLTLDDTALFFHKPNDFQHHILLSSGGRRRME